jgi:hypothetical protein
MRGLAVRICFGEEVFEWFRELTARETMMKDGSSGRRTESLILSMLLRDDGKSIGRINGQ